ncbi:MAG TPA: ATP--cob(I)alamin adenosyltransferase [Firmicutes bacterium]|nr:ATP--cob(I)alamin adenosyltransferase [Bacillota bacterium]
MHMKFVGRKKELERLKTVYDKNSFQFVLMKGRRRIGKSELIQESIRRCPYKAIYFQALDANLEANLSSLNALLCTTFFKDRRDYSSFELLLEDLFRFSSKEKFIFVIDEYPYLQNCFRNGSYLDSFLQRLIDSNRKTSQMKLVLLGSSSRIMNSLMKPENALYGRVDECISLTNMDYYEVSSFYPLYSNEEKVMAYSIFGGSPFYAAQIDQTLNVKQNVFQKIFANDVILNSISDVLGKELRNISLANMIFNQIARGIHNFNDLLKRVGNVAASSLDYSLKALEEMGLIRKITPINKERDKKKTFYYLDDFFLSFYYRYLFQNASSLAMMDHEQFYDVFIETNLEKEYLPKAFEEITRQYFLRKNKEGYFDPPFIKIGKYWYDNPESKTNGEFDLVALNAKREYLFMECKYTKEALTAKDIEKEIKQVAALHIPALHYGFCSKSGFELSDDYDKKHLTLLTLTDLYD